jgi:DNA-binding MarR family transcriptional regulator
MSHFATNWAIQQRGLDAATKVLLWHLADCHNPAQGCFPTQAYLVDRSELSRASVNRHLAILEQRGLILRERCFDADKQRQLPTRYYLACEADFETHRERLASAPRRGVKPCRNSGHGAESQKSAEPCLKSDESRVSDCDSNPVIEPVREPPARARAGRDFSNIWHDWPEAERPRNRDVAERLFNRLTPDERRSAIEFASAFRSIRAGQGAVALMIPYLREKSFVDFVGAPEIDREGYFVIRPEREEWAAWIASIRSRYSEKIVSGMIERGFMLTRSRWPEDGGGASNDGSKRESPRSGLPTRLWRQAPSLAKGAQDAR